MNPLRRRDLPALLVGLAALSPALAAAPACEPVVDAFRRSYASPYHQTVNQREDGKKTQSEMLFDGTTLYIKIDGTWYDAGAMDNPFKDLVSSVLQATACTRLREEAVGKQAATLYEVSQVVEG